LLRAPRDKPVTLPFALFAVLIGALAGLSLGLLGIGSSILVVPLLVYGMHLAPHLAIGTSTVAATVSALWSLAAHARAGTVRWQHGSTYAIASMLGAAAGARLGEVTDSHLLLGLLGVLMVVIAALMLRSSLRARSAARLSAARTPRWALPALAASGFAIGALAGLIGVGGGFLTVPALMFTAGMPLLNAVGSSLVSVAAVAATTAVSYASAHLVVWRIAALLVLGGLFGGYAGVKLAGVLATRRRALTLLFSAVVALAGLYMVVHAAAYLR
jgi:uncharacterized membrane protein YfcA